MSTKPRSASPSLEVRRTFPMARERVFHAWTDKAALSRWFAPSDEYTVVVHTLDVRVGGTYRIEMRHKSGTTHIATGNYRDIQPPERLVFTWRWEENPGMPDTIVTVALHARGKETELVLTHTGFADDAQAGDHKKGWTGCFERLAAAAV